MFCMISGGSGSGKSEFAEQRAVELRKKSKSKNFIYIATMMAYDEEAKKKIQRHRQMRAHKGFQTVECFHHLKQLEIPEESTVLLDCMSNLAANERFDPAGAGEQTVSEITAGIAHLRKQCTHLVVVTNEIFSDGGAYDADTLDYIRCMGEINTQMAKWADDVVEVVYGIPLYRKKGGSLC